MKSRKIIFFILIALLILTTPIKSNAKSITLKVQADEEANKYLSELNPMYGTLCYDLYRVYSKNNLPEDFEKRAFELSQEAVKKYIGTEGAIVNKSSTAAYSGLSLNQEYKIEDAVYLMVVRGTNDNTTVVKDTIIRGADNTTYDKGLVTFSLLDYHMYTVMPQFVMNDESITLKMESDPAVGSISINKNIKKYYADVENTTFVFRVDIYFPTEDYLFSSEVYSFNFTGVGAKSLVIEGIPIGSNVKITEVYKGLSYETFIGEDKNSDLTIKITGTERVNVEFENKYTNKINHGGGGVVNRFEFNALDGKGNWKWEKLEGNEATVNGVSDKFFEQLMKYNIFMNSQSE